MGLFGTSSPFDQQVERATSEKNTNEDWSQIMDVCDKVKENAAGPKDCMKAISKRLGSDNPRVVLQTITLLDACINNCGKRFLLEVAGRDFEQELNKLITSSKTHPKVSGRLRENLKKWAEGEFKGDPELGLIPSLYSKLVKEGHDFDIQTDPPKKAVKYSSDPNVVDSVQEEEDIAKAIQLSLQETGSSAVKSSSQLNYGLSGGSGLYSSASAVLMSDKKESPVVEKEPIKVRALYDFEAAEDNELTFKAGEIIIVTDDSYANWWKGTNHRGEGLFPANFVTKELDDFDQFHRSESVSNKKVSFNECVEITEVEDSSLDIAEEITGEINEDKIDQLLHILHEADPTGDRLDDSSLPLLEDQVNAMAPTIDAELERIDKKHAQLARISIDLVDALNLYHQLMREMPPPMPYSVPFYKDMQNPPLPHSVGMMPPNYMHPGLPPGLMHPSMYPQHMPPFVEGPLTGIPPFVPHVEPATGNPPHQANIQQRPGQPNQIGPSSAPSFSQYPEYGMVPHEQIATPTSVSASAPHQGLPPPPSTVNPPLAHDPSWNMHHSGIPPPGVGVPIHMAPVSIMPHTVVVSSPMPQGPPTSLPYYPTSPPPHFQNMQQQPLM